MNNNNKQPKITAQEIHNLQAQAKNEEIPEVCDQIMKRIASMWD